MKKLGRAADYYRLRVIRLTEENRPTLDWDDEILYRDPKTQRLRLRTQYLVQLVRLDDSKARTLKAFPSEALADTYKDRLQLLLGELTKTEFDRNIILRLNLPTF